MPLEYFVYLLVGLMHVVFNCREFWTLRNWHALLDVQQGFCHELATNYAFLINLKTKEVVIITTHIKLILFLFPPTKDVSWFRP